MTRDPIRIHAIYAVAGDEDMFPASLRSIYDQVDGITVITGYDRDWSGAAWSSDRLVDLLLTVASTPIAGSRSLSNVRRTRPGAGTVPWTSPQAPRGHVGYGVSRRSIARCVPPDYFLIIDADEVYEAGAVDRLRDYVRRRPGGSIALAHRYFKHWTYRVTGLEYSISLVRADVRLPYLRRLIVPVSRRAIARIPGCRRAARDLALGYRDVPPDVAVFHHGSYVGPRRASPTSSALFGHAHEYRTTGSSGSGTASIRRCRTSTRRTPRSTRLAREVAADELPAAICVISLACGIPA